MFLSNKPERISGLFLTFALLFSVSVFAESPLITRHFSGIWDQPEQESQGFIPQLKTLPAKVKPNSASVLTVLTSKWKPKVLRTELMH